MDIKKLCTPTSPEENGSGHHWSWARWNYPEGSRNTWNADTKGSNGGGTDVSISSRSFFHGLDKKRQEGEEFMLWIHWLWTRFKRERARAKMRREQGQTVHKRRRYCVRMLRMERTSSYLHTQNTKKTAKERDRRQRKNGDNLEETRIVVMDKQIDS